MKKQDRKRRLGILLQILLPLLVLVMPADYFPLEGITLIEKRVVAIFLLAAIFWITEPIPIYATSVLIIVLELIMVSDKGFLPLRSGDETTLGHLLSHKDIMATFASPIILLFLGGFFLAMAATKFRLDQNLAAVLLRPFGRRPARLMMGLMIITAVFSMFMSNTATTAMMLSILMPVLQRFEPGDRGRIAFALCIPIAANIGGIGTPIGTPPNAIALKYITGEHAISFGKWMAFGLPFVTLVLVFAWGLLQRLFPASATEISLDIRARFTRSRPAMIVYVTLGLTILLWLTDFLHGMNAYVVAMIPVAVFLSTGIINKEDLKKLSWDVLWLVAGGIALGLALEQSGLAERLIAAIPFNRFPPLAIVGGATILALLMANFMSHTATANLLLPIVATLGTVVSGLDQAGGATGLVLAVTISCSIGMSLPISTPPNALAHATGEFQTRDLARVGAAIGAAGLLLIYGLLWILNQVGYF